jgi:hypothetical protein
MPRAPATLMRRTSQTNGSSETCRLKHMISNAVLALLARPDDDLGGLAMGIEVK